MIKDTSDRNDDLLAGGSGKKKHFYDRMDNIILIISVVLALGLFIAVIVCDSSVTSSINTGVNEQYTKMMNSIEENAPSFRRYHVPFTSVTPVKNQLSSSMCWPFATIGILEASYRQNGVAKGFLKENEFIKFSEQAYAIGVVDYCSKNENEYCEGTGPKTGSMRDGNAEFLYYLRDVGTNTVLPSSVCTYAPVDINPVCDGREDALKSNPLSFEVTDIESAYSLSDIKSLLVRKKLPLLWSQLVTQNTYLLDCDDDSNGLKDTQVCDECSIPCTFGCCAAIVQTGYDADGIMRLHGRHFAAGYHYMLLVGFNDMFRVDTGSFGELDEKTLGGFILKNSWGFGEGHSLQYWTQEISLMDESLICPNEKYPKTWLPADYECMTANDGSDITACSQNVYKRVRDEWLYGPTYLECTDASQDEATAIFYGFENCDKTKRYVLSTFPKMDTTYQPSGAWIVPQQEQDTYIFNFLEYDPATPTAPAILKTSKSTTYLGIQTLFKPVKIVGNDENQCGYYFLPYQTFQEGIVAATAEGHHTPSVTSFDVKWDDKSYLSNKKSGYDYSLFEDSKGDQPILHFEGPFDFLYRQH